MHTATAALVSNHGRATILFVSMRVCNTIDHLCHSRSLFLFPPAVQYVENANFTVTVDVDGTKQDVSWIPLCVCVCVHGRVCMMMFSKRVCALFCNCSKYHQGECYLAIAERLVCVCFHCGATGQVRPDHISHQAQSLLLLLAMTTDHCTRAAQVSLSACAACTGCYIGCC